MSIRTVEEGKKTASIVHARFFERNSWLKPSLPVRRRNESAETVDGGPLAPRSLAGRRAPLPVRPVTWRTTGPPDRLTRARAQAQAQAQPRRDGTERNGTARNWGKPRNKPTAATNSNPPHSSLAIAYITARQAAVPRARKKKSERESQGRQLLLKLGESPVRSGSSSRQTPRIKLFQYHHRS
ncbi:hypothetical protein SEVIR_2G120450v4 [Setaria viridis]